MPIPSGQSCSNCQFIDFAGPYAFYGREAVNANGVQVGYCRVRQPVAALQPRTSYPVDRKSYVLGVEWPEVMGTDWCGDWTAQS